MERSNSLAGAAKPHSARYGIGDLLALLAAFGISAWWAFSNIIPHDSGLLADMALRVGEGKLPHLDFDDTYTGLLNWLHSAAFQIFGVRFTSLRICLLIVALPWMIVLQWLFRRVASPLASMLLLVVAVVWSLPCYAESMPSWYNVFFATWGLAALWKHAETSHGRWLVVAGICGGASALFKIVGLLFLPATALYVFGSLYLGKGSYGQNDDLREEPLLNGFGRLLITGIVIIVGTTPWLIIRRQFSVENVAIFVIPILCWTLYLVAAEWRAPAQASWSRFRRMLGNGLLLFLGAAIPLGIYLIYFYLRGGLPALLEGVFVLPFKRLTYSFQALPEISSNLYALPLVVPLALAAFSKRARFPQWTFYLLPAFLFIFLASPLRWPNSHFALVFAFRALVPALAILSAIFLLRVGSSEVNLLAQRRLSACIPVLIFINLIQFPYGFFMYFLYFFPLVVVGVAAFLSATERTGQTEQESSWLRQAMQPLCLLIIPLVLFPIFWMHGHPVADGGGSFWKRDRTVPFNNPRADSSILVPPWLNEMYAGVVDELQKTAPKGARIYAFPDCPEVPFLAEMTPVSRSCFPSLGSQPYPPTPEALLEELRREKPDVVFVNLMPTFSTPLPKATITEIYKEYPDGKLLGDSDGKLTFLILFRKPPE